MSADTLTLTPDRLQFGYVTYPRWQEIEAVFLEVVDLEPAQRVAVLEEACGRDPELLAMVEGLLRADAATDDRLEQAIANGASDLADHIATSRVGERVGAYRLVDVIGQGGMGTVYLAERADDAYRAQVAIKFVRGTLAVPDLARRFLAERQILADLNHPGIARLLDGGATTDGTPYLVLEYVEGVPIDAWCDTQQLGVRERVELFLKVCDAVQYAHDSRVVHRDLKPSNILVRADGTPKLVDFGIAKLLSDTNGADTATALRVLTPTHASPEQVRGEASTIASDVYSLGVVLYELLAGRPPLNLSHLSAGEVERRVCQEVPAPLSRASAGKDAPWKNELAGDLEDITATALRKRIDQRQPSVEALAMGLRRYLAAPPAGPLRRLAGRVRHVRRTMVVAVAVVAILVSALALEGMVGRRDAVVAFSFLPAQAIGAPVRAPFRVVAADVNGDGRGDLVWNHIGPAINQFAVALGLPDGTLVMQPVVTDSAPFAEWNEGFQLVVGDFNGDGRDDLLWNRARNGQANLAWLGFANADGTFRFSGADTVGGPTMRWGTGWEVLVGDLDNDGSDDLVFNNRGESNSMWTFRSLRYGRFSLTGPRLVHPARGWGGYRAFIADADGDGRADIVWNDVPVWANRTYVARSKGAAFDLLPQQDHTVPDGWSDFTTSVLDIDGDGISDIVWTRPDAGSLSVYVALGRPTASFEFRPLQQLRLPPGTQLSARLSGDFNGDGRTDLIWHAAGGGLWAMPGSRMATLGIAAARGADAAPEALLDGSPFEVLVIDVNGDQRDDLAWVERTGHRVYFALARSPRSWPSSR